MKKARNYRDYNNYLNHQKEKTTDLERRKKWLNEEWGLKLNGFKRIFNQHSSVIKRGMNALCIGARTGQEVVALKEMGVDAIGIDIVAHPPNVISGDMHKLDFPDDSFDFIFSNVFDHSLYPHRKISEIERVLKFNGYALMQFLTVNTDHDKYSETLIDCIDRDVVSLFKKSLCVLNDKVPRNFAGMDYEILMRKDSKTALLQKDDLLDYKSDKYTAIGNDGIIEKIFDTIGVKKGFFVEFGAWDGIKGSNCRKLFDEGWSGIFIEPDKKRFHNLEKNYKDHQNIICINSTVEIEKNLFDGLVEEHVYDKIDFCSIDIDGLDLEVFETFTKFMPTVVCIEGGQMLEPFSERIPSEMSSHNIQQSLKVLCEVFEQKGYRLLCTHQDSFFIKEENYDLFNVEEDLMILYLNGLSSIHRRLPWINQVLLENGLKNRIISYTLSNSNYSQYGYHNRKLWAEEQKETTKEFIDLLKTKYLNKK